MWPAVPRLLIVGVSATLLVPAWAAAGPQRQPRQSRPDAARRSDRPARPPQTPVFDVMEKSIAELQAAMTAGVVTSRELVSAYLARIDAYDRNGPRLRAIILVNPHALDDADALDRERRDRGPRGPLHGIPIVVKDNFETRDLPTTAGSLSLAGMETHRDAFQVRKLRDAGAVILAKTNLHELASGITTISSLGGQTLNPYDLSRAPGGSSGGTGAAVAANFAAAGMGTDTCGSIRIPAANNNLFGLRATLGLSSRHGVVPLSHSQDMAGPLARSVSDLAVMLDATVGRDPEDPVTSAGEGHVPASYRDALRVDGLKGARIGVLKDLFGDAQEDQDVAGIVRRAIDALRKEGAETVEVAVPGLDDLLRGASVINWEFKFDLASYLKEIADPPVKSVEDIIDGGRFHASLENGLKARRAVVSQETDDYRRALVKRQALRAAVTAVLDEYRLDAIVYPTLRRKPVTIGEAQLGSNCQLSATSGLPALGVPAGFTDDGLPVGMDLLGGPFSEARLLSLAYAYELAATPRRAPLMTPALVDGRPPAVMHGAVTVRMPPASGARASAETNGTFAFDPASSILSYQLTTLGLGVDVVATIHRAASGGASGALGPAVSRLAAGATSAGSLLLGPSDRRALEEGRLYLEVFDQHAPAAQLRAPIRLSAAVDPKGRAVAATPAHQGLAGAPSLGTTR